MTGKALLIRLLQATRKAVTVGIKSGAKMSKMLKSQSECPDLMLKPCDQAAPKPLLSSNTGLTQPCPGTRLVCA